MTSILVSDASFFILLSLFAMGGVGALLLSKKDVLANAWSSFFAITGSVWSLAFSASILISGRSVSFLESRPIFPFFSTSFTVDQLSAFFILAISLISLFCSIYGIGYIKHFYGKYNVGTLGFFYNIFIAGMMLVVTASNALLFLVAWEIMSIASYFLVSYEHKNEQNTKAGLVYIIMTHAGTACIIFFFLLLYKFTGSFDFESIKSGIATVPLLAKNTIFILALLGFGVKAGIVPLHIWLPSAHPAAPSHVSALMSGVMIKTGVFMMIRMFLDILQPIPAWWGLAVLVIGAASSLIGVLYALTEHDIKRLLAYHSIENIGIILMGLGSAMTFLSLNMPQLALLGFGASLFHTINHAVFKSLLFLGAGSVINQTHTRNMEEYGGLIKRMPHTALYFLIGSMAISALPPLNGFFSEWLTFQSLFQGITALNLYAKWIFIFAAGSLAFTGGLALACFVKAFGVTFLARPRSAHASGAKESSAVLLFGMGALAISCLLLGIFSANIAEITSAIGNSLDSLKTGASVLAIDNQAITVQSGFASISAPLFLMLFLLVTILTIALTTYAINKKQKIVIGATWDCGTDLNERMEITATGFSRSIVLIFKRVLRPSIQHEIEYHDSESRYYAKSRTTTLHVSDVYRVYFYQPLQKLITLLSLRVKSIQTGNINTYILYMFLALIVLLLFVVW